MKQGLSVSSSITPSVGSPGTIIVSSSVAVTISSTGTVLFDSLGTVVAILPEAGIAVRQEPH